MAPKETYHGMKESIQKRISRYQAGMAASTVGAITSLSAFAYHNFEMNTPAEHIPPVGLIFSAMTFAGFYAAEKEFKNEEAPHEPENADTDTLAGETAAVHAVPKIILRSSDYPILQEIHPFPTDSGTVPSSEAISLLKDESSKRG